MSTPEVSIKCPVCTNYTFDQTSWEEHVRDVHAPTAGGIVVGCLSLRDFYIGCALTGLLAASKRTSEDNADVDRYIMADNAIQAAECVLLSRDESLSYCQEAQP